MIDLKEMHQILQSKLLLFSSDIVNNQLYVYEVWPGCSINEQVHNAPSDLN